jgi:hypothetical protein
VAIAALALWISTVAIGTYLLATAARIGKTESAPSEPTESAPSEPVPVSAGQTGASSANLAAAAPMTPLAERLRVNKDDRYAPPSLRAERSEPLPGMKELAEFAHPALALIGLAFWIGYVISRDRIMLAIGLGNLRGAVVVHRQHPRRQARSGRRHRHRGPQNRAAVVHAPGPYPAHGRRGPDPAVRRFDRRPRVVVTSRAGSGRRPAAWPRRRG